MYSSGSPLFSRIRSSRVPMKLDTSRESQCQEILAPSIPLSSGATAFEIFVHTVAESRLPGPAIIMDSRTNYLGQGSQFIVHESIMIQSENGRHITQFVAVKQPKFNMSPSQRLSLADTGAQRQLHDLLLEIRALTSPSLLGHPNIAQILYWSWNSSTLHTPINLIMELASSDLRTYLEEMGKDMSICQKNTLCSDLARGLDAIHKCQLVHGDLKPSNILIFDCETRVTAKLADFGLSAEELDSREEWIQLGGTEGWQAPEVTDGLLIPADQLHKADNYSFGLVVWSVLLGSMNPPLAPAMNHQQTTVEQEFRKEIEKRRNYGFGNTKGMIHKLLSREPPCRPDVLEHLFDTPTTVEPQELNFVNVDLFPWEVKHLSSYFLPALSTRLKDSSEGFSTSLLTSMLMSMTVRPGALLPSDDRVIDVILNLAWKGSSIAKALVPNVLDFYGRETPPEVLHHIVPWIKDAIESGSVLARSDLERLDPAALAESIRAFQNHGGYSNIYARSPSCTVLHEIVISSTRTRLRDFLSSHNNSDIEEPTACDETPLYLACARGEMDIVTELISSGASASVACTEFGISCLHWLFTYAEPFISRATIKLIEAGAVIDAMTVEPVPFPHYPFILPAGTALHWATASRNHSATKALIEQGASLNIRNGSDPYRYDRRVRVQESVGIDQNPYSEPQRPTQGLSPLDCAAMHHDPFIFEALYSLGKRVDINAADEEGFTVLHRLSGGHIYHTREGGEFSLLPFQGRPDTQDQNLRRTISAIKSLGGNLETLTTPWTSHLNLMVGGRTALMLAVESGLPNVVRALIDAGACPNTENEVGKTALFYLSEQRDVDFESAKILISAGADVNHRANHGKGNSALCVAAFRTNLDLVDLLLSCGANIEERYLDSSSIAQKRLCSIFGLLAKRLPGIDNQDAANDRQVANILEKYLFTAPDADQRHRIMEHDAGGRTLLYRFSEVAFPCTVDSLLRHGAQIGPQAECCLERDPDALPLKSYETPLYTARNFKRSLDDAHDLGERTKTVSEYHIQCERMNSVVKSLIDAGWR